MPATSTPQIGLRINGESRRVPVGATVDAVLHSMSIDPRLVAVELDGRIVPRTERASTVVAEGARLEIVRFVQGG